MGENKKQFKREFPRRHVYIPCRLAWQDHRVSGTTVDVSYMGVAVIHIAGGIVLRALPVYVQHRLDSQRAGFKVMHIESGDLEWGKLCYVPQW